jgi:protein-disulfide isomerase
MLMKAVALLALVSFAPAMTVPHFEPGIAYGPAYSNRTLEVFMDHLCSACKATWPGLREYYDANSDWLKLIVHMFPLPYHHNSFIVT